MRAEKPIDKVIEAAEFRKSFLSDPEFDINKADTKILNSIFAWVWRDDRFNTLKLDYDKGLWLFGDLGRGKSTALMALRRYLIGVRARYYDIEKKDTRLGSYWQTASQLASLYASDGQAALAQYYAPTCCLFIDELGREPIPASNYGTKMNVLQFLLQMRYDNRRTSVTHVTTNISIDQIAAFYGDYIADRCLEMFNFIKHSGESLR